MERLGLCRSLLRRKYLGCQFGKLQLPDWFELEWVSLCVLLVGAELAGLSIEMWVQLRLLLE